MRKKPFYLPIAILITTLALGISVPAFFLANRSGQASFSTVDPTPTLQPKISIMIPPGRETAQDSLHNCTYHAYHWITQPEAWPAQVTLGGVTYSRADMLNLRDAPQGDPAIDLVKEALIAIVNIYNGASQSRIEGTLVEADNWLSSHQDDGALSEFNQQQARSFMSTLENFNNGMLYPASCPDQIPLPVAELVSEETTPTETVASAANSLDGVGSEDNRSGTNTTFQPAPPAAEPTPQPTGAPPARSTVQRPIETPVAPPSQLPPGNPDKDNPGRGHGNGNGNPGQENQGQGNENRGQGNKGDGKDKPGPGNEDSKKGGGNDNPEQETQSHGNGKGNGDPGNVNKGKGQEGSSGEGEGDKGKVKEDGSGKDEGDKGKDKEDGSGKGEDNKGKDKDKKGP